MNDLSWWTPSLHEFGMFVAVITTLFIIASLFHYNSVQVRVKKESRCLREKNSIKSNGIYVATAANKHNDPLYKVGYNMAAKSYSVECACKEGNVANTFPNINVYNLSTQTVQQIDQKLCSCEKQYLAPTDSVYFSGYPGVVRFMNSAASKNGAKALQTSDVSFFDTALENRL